MNKLAPSGPSCCFRPARVELLGLLALLGLWLRDEIEFMEEIGTEGEFVDDNKVGMPERTKK